ncbi:GNAT family protein [Chitinophagaceae bacterium 26-R-25]|nr:GNAT family protein [Chitinophagaceae bacterium 26-R-25]
MEFDFSTDYILEDDRVLLRPLEKGDAEFLVPFAEHEPDIWKFSTMPVAGSDNMKKYIDLTVQARIDKKEYPFIVFDKSENAYAGSTRFYDIQLTNQTLQLGYTWYGKKFQRSGLNRHCKLLLLTFAFEKIDMERVEFRADVLNEKSVNAMKNIGCTVEGVLRNSMPKMPDGRRDTIVLSILKNEWFDHVKENLVKKIDYTT